MTIFIQFKNGDHNVWEQSEFTSYGYDGKYFRIIKGKYLVGFYNLDEVAFITVTPPKETTESEES